MTKGATKDQAEEVRQYVMDQLVAENWVKKVYLDTDDHGWCVVVKVAKAEYQASGHHIPAAVNEVKVLTMMVS